MAEWQNPFGPLVLSDGTVVEYDPNDPGHLWTDDGSPIVPSMRPSTYQVVAAGEYTDTPVSPSHSPGAAAPEDAVAAGGTASSESGIAFTDGTVVEVMRWVAGDKERARVALDAESAKESPRKGLVSQLSGVLNAD